MSKKIATNLGFDISTTSIGAGVRDANGSEGYASVPVAGAITWKDQPAFLSSYLPSQIQAVLGELENQDWVFTPAAPQEPKYFSSAVRQHDLACCSERLAPLIPLLSWQCIAAKQETEELNAIPAVRDAVGRLEERFILPKLKWALTQKPSLTDDLYHVMTTGDWIAARLTGITRLSASDALSNGLLRQSDKTLASDAIRAADLNPNWFPDVIPSGQVVGQISQPADPRDAWLTTINKLLNWQVVACLGDNHGTGVGCGLADENTIVISAGSSGTVNRMCRPEAELVGNAACFEYYDNRLLLMMLPDCCIWYNRWRDRDAPNKPHTDLNKAASDACPVNIVRITHNPQETDSDKRESYPTGWPNHTLPFRVASTQYSIALELLLLVQKMLFEVKTDQPITNFVITGGLSQSLFFQAVLKTGIELLVPGATVSRNAKQSPLAFQTAALGAVYNSMLPRYRHNLTKLLEEQCQVEPVSFEASDQWSICLLEYLERDLQL